MNTAAAASAQGFATVADGYLRILFLEIKQEWQRLAKSSVHESVIIAPLRYPRALQEPAECHTAMRASRDDGRLDGACDTRSERGNCWR